MKTLKQLLEEHLNLQENDLYTLEITDTIKEWLTQKLNQLQTDSEQNDYDCLKETYLLRQLIQELNQP